MIYGWIWVAILVISIVIEILTDRLIAIWCVPSAIVAVAMDLLDLHILWQVLVFIILTAVGIIFAKGILVRFRSSKKASKSLDDIVGDKCVVTDRIDNYAGCGQVKVNGQNWSARSAFDDDTFEIGEVLHIVAIEGVKLICKK